MKGAPVGRLQLGHVNAIIILFLGRKSQLGDLHLSHLFLLLLRACDCSELHELIYFFLDSIDGFGGISPENCFLEEEKYLIIATDGKLKIAF